MPGAVGERRQATKNRQHRHRHSERKREAMRNRRNRQRKTGNTDTDTVRERKLEKQATTQLPKHRDFDESTSALLTVFHYRKHQD